MWENWKSASFLAPIIPFVTMEGERFELRDTLCHKGFLVRASMFPAVLKGRERVRVTIRVENTE